MPQPKLSKLELQLMDVLWERGPSTVRDVQESFPAVARPAYNTVQTMMVRLEAKGAVRRADKSGTAHIFEAAVSRNATQRRLIDDVLALSHGRSQPLMNYLIEAGKLTLDDVQQAEKTLRQLSKKGK